jgi:LysR family transcriptional regulator, cell division regulator
MPNRSLLKIGVVMDATDLKVFEAVARHGSMNRAAAELNTVQSNITARVRALELELGVLLFQRHARGVTVTPAGRRMLPFSARIARLLSDAKAAARDDGVPGGMLEVGTLETTAALRLPSVLASFANAYPNVRLVVTTGTTCSLIEDVVECRLEGAFVAGPVDHPDLQQESLFREELVLVTPRSIRGIEDLSSINDLKTIVFRIGCSYRTRLENLLNKAGILVAQPLEFGSIEAILGCVAAGVGIALLPKGVVVQAWRDGRVAMHELDPEIAEVQTVFVRRADGYVSSALSAFLQIVRPDTELNVAAE